MVDINGCTTTATHSFTITGPTARFTAVGGCKNSLVTFIDKSDPYPGSSGPPADTTLSHRRLEL